LRLPIACALGDGAVNQQPNYIIVHSVFVKITYPFAQPPGLGVRG
jgi:hypothetical protein